MKRSICLSLVVCLGAGVLALALPGCKPEELGAAHPTTVDYYDKEDVAYPEPRMPLVPKSQTEAEMMAKSQGCISCHKGIGDKAADGEKFPFHDTITMHFNPAVKIGCTDCHGGDATVSVAEGASEFEKESAKKRAHVQPRGHWYHFTPMHSSPRKPLQPHPVKHPEGKAPAAADGKHADGDKKDGHAAAHDDHGHGAHGADKSHGGHGDHHTSAANPIRSGQAWIMESPEFVRFVNPADLRVAKYTCGPCHAAETKNVPLSMMAHGAMLWNAALYNNGAMNQKIGRYGEAYTYDGKPARLQTIPRPTAEETKTRGVLPYLDPLPRYNITQSGNILRVFERGGRLKLETALPDRENEPGKPEVKLSIRGIGTFLATDPVFLGLQKTRLLDPMLWHLGTNDQAGDYRSSGCSACHVIYANDRDPAHSGLYAKYGKDGHSFTKDEALKHIVQSEHGHPIKHVFTRAIPSSQCVVCHMHPGTTVTNTYYGTIWWDNETEGHKMYPKTHKPKMGERQAYKIKNRNPEGSALRGLWGNVKFAEGLADRNAEFKQVQFADFNGHGWIFRNVYKMDRKGHLLDLNDKIVPFDSPDKFAKGPDGRPIAGSAVHMQDIHQELGMHCIDCHFYQDNHGNGKLYAEVRNATEIMCADCHGTIYKKATLVTSGNAAPDKGTEGAGPDGGTEMLKDGRYKTAFGKRFKVQGGKIFQQSAVDPNLQWEVTQTIDTINPAHPKYNEKSRLAKTMRKDAKTWGDVPADPKVLAHQDERMDCYTCHTSWMASCFGCHLPMRANQARYNNHYEGAKSRNWTQYNFQTLREDVFMLGHDGTVKKNKIAPVRSTCAVIVGSQNAQREWTYSQQQTISAEGFSGQAFSPHYPHAVRGKETKQCTDCHVSRNGDNNAWMAQVLMQGTNQTNFMYRFVYVALAKGGVAAVGVTERDEPQAVVGSTLHRDAYPDEYKEFVENGREIKWPRYHHHGQVYGVQLRGEYLYAARGSDGLTIYDVANIDNKGFSERIITAPVSPLGQRFYVKSKDCTSVISPTVLGVDPTRQPPFRPRDPFNQEQGIHPIYAFLYCTDRQEGLFTVMAATLLDGDPTNNFLRRHMTFNPDGILNGAVGGTVAGNYLYVVADAGLVIVDISKIGTELVEAALRLNPDGTKVLKFKDLEKVVLPPDPNLLRVVGVIPMNKPKAVRVQFRYAFVVDSEGLKVVDVTNPEKAVLVPKAFVPFREAHNVYLSRTYAYVAAGSEGMAIVDIEKAEEPKLDQTYTADGRLCDVRDIKIGMTNASVFAYVANGRSGLAVVQLTSPESVPTYLGWSARPKPELIATSHLHGEAVALSEGLQRDRGVDESGNQLSVFNRVGSRPFNKQQAEKLYKLDDGTLFTVTNEKPSEPLEFKAAGGGPSQEQLDKQKKLEEDIKKEKNPAKKKKLEAELEELKKEIEKASQGGGEEKKAKIEKLEADIKKEKNPAKKKKLEAELEELKKK